MTKPDKHTKHETGHDSSGKAAGRAYCVRCGLMYLRNEASQQAIRERCPDARP